MSTDLKTENRIPVDGELYFYEHFLEPTVADHHFEKLLNEVPWQKRSITLFGKTVDQPRLISWHAEEGIEYRYSGVNLTPSAWNRSLLELKQKIESKIDGTFNSAFLNLYRDGHDYMGWHRDNEKSLGPRPMIASVSLGAARKFKLRHIHQPDLKHELILNPGSVLIMSGDLQHYWKHCLPKSLRITAPRINITFRQIYR